MAEDWRLRDEQGNVRALSTEALRDGLSRGTIPSSAQVARPGSEFKPAFSVPELATAAIRAKRMPSIPPTGAPARPGAVTPHKGPGGPKPARAVEVPPPPRSRRRIQHTLVGIHGDEDGLPGADEGAPIVAPGAGGAIGSAPRAITQVPRYTPAPSSAAGPDVVIPRAPKAPSTTLNATDHGWDDAETTQGSSIFDDDETLVKRDAERGAPRSGPRSQPPPLPAKPGAEPRTPRTTVMGMGAHPGLAPRLIPPRQASTPPPPAVGAGGPPPVPKRTPAPPPARPASTSSSALKPVAPTSARTPSPPSARTPQPASVRPPPPPPPVKAPVKTPTPPSAAARAEATTKAEALATAAALSRREPPPKRDEAAEVTAPTNEVPPTSMPEAREATTAPVVTQEGTPPPDEEPRESRSDVDEAPTSKMAVQVVHGAALAMRAALAAPHPRDPVAITPAPGAAVGATPAPGPASSGPDGSSPLPGEGTRASDAPERDTTEIGPAVSALPLPPSTGVTLRGLGTSSAPPRTRTSSSPPTEDDDQGPQSGVEVPVSSLFAASAVWIVGLVLVFFVGRCSALEARAPVARRGVAAGARLAVLDVIPATGGAAPSEPKPCWVTRQPSRWAKQASKNVPFEMVPVPGGSAMLVGYAASDELGIGARIDPKTGKLAPMHEQKVEGGVGRITPIPSTSSAPPTFFASSADAPTVLVASERVPPLFVRFGASGLEVLPAADATDGERVFALEGDGKINAEQLTSAGAEGVFASFRRGDAVRGAWIGKDHKARGEVRSVVGSGGTVGKPRAGWNGRQVAVVFADRPEGGRWQVRIGRAAAGDVPATTEVFELPAGGPGGDAIAPDVVGLADGRWLVMWTEGSAGSRAIRSITLAPDFTPIGDPIALSPPAGNFGQAQLGVVGSYVTVLFLQKGDEDFELWGAVLQCGG